MWQRVEIGDAFVEMKLALKLFGDPLFHLLLKQHKI